MSPSVAALPLFFAARACPLSLRTFLAPSTSPSASSSARFTSIIPAAVSSRSCLIFSIVLAKVTTSPRSLRSLRPAPPLQQARTLLSRVLLPEARQPSQVRRPPHRRPQVRLPQPLPPRPRPPALLRPRSRPRLRARPQPLLWVRLPVLPRLLVRPLGARHWSRVASLWDPPPSAGPRPPPGTLRSPAAQVVRRPALPRPCRR